MVIVFGKVQNLTMVERENSIRSRALKEIIKKHYTYNKEGFKRPVPRQEDRDAGKHIETICGCRARKRFS